MSFQPNFHIVSSLRMNHCFLGPFCNYKRTKGQPVLQPRMTRFAPKHGSVLLCSQIHILNHASTANNVKETSLQHIGLVAVVLTWQRFNPHRRVVTLFFPYIACFLRQCSWFSEIYKKSDHEKLYFFVFFDLSMTSILLQKVNSTKRNDTSCKNLPNRPLSYDQQGKVWLH